MKKHKTVRLLSVGVFIAVSALGAEPGFTCNWTVEPGESVFPMEWRATNFASETNRVFVGIEELFRIYDRSNNLIQEVYYNNSITWPIRMLMDTNNLYVLYRGQYGSGNNERGLRAYNKSDLSILWTYPTPSVFYFAEAMVMDDQYLYVANTGKDNICVFVKATGDFVRSWGGSGSFPEQFDEPWDIALSGELLYIADKRHSLVKIFTKFGSFIRSIPAPFPQAVSVYGDFVYVGAADGLRIYDKNDNLLWISAPEDELAGAKAYQDQGKILLLKSYKGDETWLTDQYRFLWLTGPVYRTLGQQNFNHPPAPVVSNVVQRTSAGILDIDYVVHDADDTAVTVYPLAFQVSASGAFNPNLTNCIPMHTFVEGTDANVGSNILVDTSRRLSWDVTTDGVQGVLPDYGNVKVAVLARDHRQGLLDLHFLQIPALNGNPALTINRVPLQHADFLPVWFWLIASKDDSVTLTTNGVVAVGGAYDGQVLAAGTNTTTNGVSFLFERMNVRAATPQEVQLAREAGTPGTVQEWTPLRTPPALSNKVNAIGFVTDPTNGWWVVPLP